jgi:uncharacterized membrane protein YfcA
MDQHLAQGTSLFILLPPLGIGALREYWTQGQVDLRAGILCAVGMLAGGYLGGRIAVPLDSQVLKGLFGCFLMTAALLLWRRSGASSPKLAPPGSQAVANDALRSLGIFAAAGACGVAAGLFGIGGGVLLVPLLALLFGFGQHRAQGTSLIALIPPTGLLAFLVYAKAGDVSWKTGLLLIPGVFIGGIVGGRLAKRLNPRHMRQVFAGLMFALGLWQAGTAWWR